MSKSLKKDLSIPSIPDTLFVVELDCHILLTGFPIKESVFPTYRFDNNSETAYELAEQLALDLNKLVVNAVDFHIDDPLIYDARKMHEQMTRLNELVLKMKVK